MLRHLEEDKDVKSASSGRLNVQGDLGRFAGALAMQERLEHWIQLQQFLHGLEDGYSYAAKFQEASGKIQAKFIIRAGGRSWYGVGTGCDKEQAAMRALAAAAVPVSSSWLRVLMFHFIRVPRIRSRISRWLLAR